MDSLTLTRLIGIGILAAVFALTVLLMPWIFGENPPRENARVPDPTPADEGAVSRLEHREISLKR